MRWRRKGTIRECANEYRSEKYGYQMAKEAIYKLVENEALKNQQSVIKKIVSYWETKEENVRRAVEAEFLC